LIPASAASMADEDIAALLERAAKALREGLT
jgi:hypothetical protein